MFVLRLRNCSVTGLFGLESATKLFSDLECPKTPIIGILVVISTSCLETTFVLK